MVEGSVHPLMSRQLITGSYVSIWGSGTLLKCTLAVPVLKYIGYIFLHINIQYISGTCVWEELLCVLQSLWVWALVFLPHQVRFLPARDSFHGDTVTWTRWRFSEDFRRETPLREQQRLFSRSEVMGGIIEYWWIRPSGTQLRLSLCNLNPGIQEHLKVW